jgi:hypothetical protein
LEAVLSERPLMRASNARTSVINLRPAASTPAGFSMARSSPGPRPYFLADGFTMLSARRILRRPERLQLPLGPFHFVLKHFVPRRSLRLGLARFTPSLDLVKKGRPVSRRCLVPPWCCSGEDRSRVAAGPQGDWRGDRSCVARTSRTHRRAP